MTQPVHKKFEFGTVFGDGGQVTRAPAQKRSYTPDEVEILRTNAYHDGEQSALARAQMAQAQALQMLADNAHQGLSTLHDAIAAHKAACAQLALICAQKIAAEALNRFPEAPLKATLEALTQEIDTATRLVVSVPNPDAALQGAAREAVGLAGFTGAITFRTSSTMPSGAFEVMWPEGRAEFDPERVLSALDTTLREALAADHHHQAASAVKKGGLIMAENFSLEEFGETGAPGVVPEDDGDKTAADLAPVFDVPVNISAVLGKSYMSVSQLLKLGQGSILELDRKVGEAIDIYVNNRLVARGEVVVVDERLGVTMTEIIKSEDSNS